MNAMTIEHDKSQFKVVIIGGIHHNTLGVIRSMGQAGITPENIELILIDKNNGVNDFVSKSKYIQKNSVFYLHSYDGIINLLTELADKNGKKVIICCADGASEVVMNNYDRLKESYYCQSLGVDTVLFFDKNEQSMIAKESGFPIPKSMVLNAAEDIEEWNLFPCIVKPIKSINGGGKSDIFISACKDELNHNLGRIESDVVQIQEYIEKKFEYQLIGCSLMDGEKVLIPGYTRIIRQPGNTNTGYLRYAPISGLKVDMERINEYFRRLKYNGLFSIEFIRDENDVDYYLETNLRNDGNAYCVKSAGVNLPYIWCYYQIHNCLPAHIATSFERPVYFMPEFADIGLGIRSVGVFKWLYQVISAQSHSIFNLQDMKPFYAKAKYYLRSHLK